MDSAGDTIDFLLVAKRDADAAKRFFQKALRSPNHPRPTVICVDRNPSYTKVIEELKRTREFGRRCRYRPIRYLKNVVEQDHRAINTAENNSREILMPGLLFELLCRLASRK